jgi:hypothetical protein
MSSTSFKQPLPPSDRKHLSSGFSSDMLRATQRAVSTIQSTASVSLLRWFGAPSWPAEVPTPAGVKPFDPNGPPSQIDALAEGLDHNDPFVKLALDMKDLRVAVDKLHAESSLVRGRLVFPWSVRCIPVAELCRVGFTGKTTYGSALYCSMRWHVRPRSVWNRPGPAEGAHWAVF